MIDVSVPLTGALPTWPGSPGLTTSQLLSISSGDVANASLVALDVHTGTHIDAPRHFVEGGATVESIPLDRLNGPAFVADVPIQGSIEPEHLAAANIPAGAARVLLRTTNSAVTDLYERPFWEDYAALSPSAAQWVVEHGIDVIGIDYLSIQRFADPPDAHTTILGAGLVIIEGLDLRAAAAGWHDMICMPIPLAGLEAAPARVALQPSR